MRCFWPMPASVIVRDIDILRHKLARNRQPCRHMPVRRQNFDFSVLHDLRFQNRPVGTHRHFKPFQVFQPGHFLLHVQFFCSYTTAPSRYNASWRTYSFSSVSLPPGLPRRKRSTASTAECVVHPFHGSVVGIVDCALDFEPQLVAAVFKIRNNRQAFRRAGQIVPRQCRNFLFRRKSKRGQAPVADHAPQHFVGNFLICHAGNSRLEQMFPQKGNVHFVIPVVIVIVRQIAQAQPYLSTKITCDPTESGIIALLPTREICEIFTLSEASGDADDTTST